MRELAITPTALSGDRLPALAPLATISAVRNAGMPVRRPIAIASGATSATLAIAPGPSVATTPAIAKMMSGTARTLPRGGVHEPVGEAPDRAVFLGQAEEERDAGEGDEERCREAGQHDVGGAPGVGAERPGHGHRQEPDVDARGAAEDNGREQRGQRRRGGSQRPILRRRAGCRIVPGRRAR